MIVRNLFSTLLVVLVFTLSGCSLGTDSPSDSKIKEIITSGVENSMDAFCMNAKVKSLEIDKRGEPYAENNTVYYPVRVTLERECSQRGMLSGKDKPSQRGYEFYLNSYDEWRSRRTTIDI